MATATSKLTKRRYGWEWTVWLAPVPAARPRVSRWGTYYPKKYSEFMKAYGSIINEIDLPPCVADPMAIWIEIVAPSPAKPANPYPMGDFDNYEKACTDKLSGAGFYVDDKQIDENHASKRYVAKGEQPHFTIHASLEGWARTPQDFYAKMAGSNDVLDQPDTISLEELENEQRA